MLNHFRYEQVDLESSGNLAETTQLIHVRAPVIPWPGAFPGHTLPQTRVKGAGKTVPEEDVLTYYAGITFLIC